MSLLLLFTVVVLALWKFDSFAIRTGLIDKPNQRSSHTMAKPRAGGLVFISAWLIWLFFTSTSPSLLTLFVPSLVLIAGIGFLDDRFTLSAKWRLCVQIIATSLFLLQLHLTPFLFIAAFFSILWSINLFNFMDGTDGIAGIEAITVLGGISVFLWHIGAAHESIVALGLVVAILGFLVWNWPPAKIFMGDVGSTSIGFMIPTLTLIAYSHYQLSLIPVIILYGVFLFDATVTLIRRILRGEKWYQAHRSHAYQRLHQAGFSHKQVLFCIMGLNLILTALAQIAFANQNLQWFSLAVSIILLSSSYLLVERIGVNPAN